MSNMSKVQKLRKRLGIMQVIDGQEVAFYKHSGSMNMRYIAVYGVPVDGELQAREMFTTLDGTLLSDMMIEVKSLDNLGSRVAFGSLPKECQDIVTDDCAHARLVRNASK